MLIYVVCFGSKSQILSSLIILGDALDAILLKQLLLQVRAHVGGVDGIHRQSNSFFQKLSSFLCKGTKTDGKHHRFYVFLR